MQLFSNITIADVMGWAVNGLLPNLVVWLIGAVAVGLGALISFLGRDNMDMVKHIVASLAPINHPVMGEVLAFHLDEVGATRLNERFPTNPLLRRSIRKAGRSGRTIQAVVGGKKGFEALVLDFIAITPHREVLVKAMRGAASASAAVRGVYRELCNRIGCYANGVMLLTSEPSSPTDRCFRNIIMHPETVRQLAALDPSTVHCEFEYNRELLQRLCTWARIYLAEGASVERANAMIKALPIRL